MALRVLLYVQHLLGIGHQRRAATLTRALRGAGLDVMFVSGGHDVPNLRLAGAQFAQLPPTRATDLYFKSLVDAAGHAIDDDWRAKRRDKLLDIFHDYRPQALVIELFPFGRRQMRFELLPLLDAAKAATPAPVIVSSVRDILVAQHKQERNDEMLARVETYFDHVFVHGDPDFIPFDLTFPHARRIAEKLIYTGYVVDRFETSATDSSDGQDEIVVSAGGGAVGQTLLETALRARPLSQARDLQWRLLAGVNASEETLAQLTALAGEIGNGTGPPVIVEPSRGDFPALLKRCRLSISQAGYNTIMELLSAEARAVVVPYAGGIETEQTLRARRLGGRTALQIVDEASLTPERLATAADNALTGPRLHFAGIQTNGAAATAEHLQKLIQSRAGQE